MKLAFYGKLFGIGFRYLGSFDGGSKTFSFFLPRGWGRRNLIARVKRSDFFINRVKNFENKKVKRSQIMCSNQVIMKSWRIWSASRYLIRTKNQNVLAIRAPGQSPVWNMYNQLLSWVAMSRSLAFDPFLLTYLLAYSIPLLENSV